MHASDNEARARAIDPNGSFIVQAPAGSGKTELLTQRFLRLLAAVEHPEQVLAITFTRKATQEMRERILLRLRQAATDTGSEEAHVRIAIEFARQVLERDREKSWNLQLNPGRLQIHTIDGLCARISARNTLADDSLHGLTVAEDARPLYREASLQLLEDIGRPGKVNDAYDALVRTLAYLHGNTEQLVELLSEMLSRRDQWLNRMAVDNSSLKAALATRQVLELAYLNEVLGEDSIEELNRQLLSLCEVADDQARANEIMELHAVAASADASPGDATRALHSSLGAVSTASGQPFSPRSVNKNFLPGTNPGRDEQLAVIKEILAGWHGKEPCSKAFARFVGKPPIEEGSGQFSLLQDLRLLLKIASAELKLMFVEKSQADYLYFAESALLALGEDIAPGDALLIEDQKLAHVLMDEFQDTSFGQFQLVRKLVSGWEHGDGRSLFLVGDPMQSIYRFRQAEVGLFKKVVNEQRLGDVHLDCLQLSSNFRSTPEIISWVNEHFHRIFNNAPGPGEDAVSYAPVNAQRNYQGQVIPLTRNEEHGPLQEASEIADIICRRQTESPDAEIAVLARKRKQLEIIAGELQRREIPFEAVQVESLASRPVIQDLLCFTRAILHAGDRIAWLGLLRGPWCGLELKHLHCLAGDDAGSDLFERMKDSAVLEELPPDLETRTRSLGSLMEELINHRGKLPVDRLVESAWVRSGAAYAAGSRIELENAQSFFRLLSEVERENPDDFLGLLQDELGKLYSASRNAKVKLMTIHKAKGLEFDTVILPSLHEPGPNPDRPLLRIQEVLAGEGSSAMMAPIKRRGFKGPSLYDYLGLLDAEADMVENQRTLYVAATRARNELYLSASWRMKGSKGKRAPGCDPRSFMNMLWPCFVPLIDDDEDLPPGADEPVAPALPLLRLQNIPEPEALKKPDSAQRSEVELRIADRDSVALGEALHLWLELVHDHWGDHWDMNWFETNQAAVDASLLRSGADEAAVTRLRTKLLTMLKNVFQQSELIALVSPAGKPGSWAELKLISAEGVRIATSVIDRIYKDESGDFVVIDYKTGSGSGAAENSWQKQLDRYVAAVEGCTSASVREARILHIEDKPEIQ